MKKLTYFTLAILLFVFGAAAFAEDGGLLGKEAPDFTLKDLNGKSWTLSDLRHEKVVLLEFGRVTCPACVEAGKGFKTLDEKYSNKGLQVLSINLDGPMWRKQVNDYVAREKIKYPVLRDPERKTMQSYKTEYIPLLVLVDRKGVVQFVQQGYSEDILKALSGKIEELLPKKSD